MPVQPIHGRAGACPGAVLAIDGARAHAGEPGLLLAADSRLENRAALAEHLGLPRGAADAAVIAAAYRRWGIACPERLGGAFAFALWDETRRRLLCARDRMGIRPFFYTIENGVLRFAQSSTRLNRARAAPGALRDAAIADFLFGRVLDAGGTWFEDIERLPAGHALVFEAGRARLHRYHDLAPAPPPPPGAAAGAFRNLLGDAVARLAEGPGRVGVLLSGGLDSSAIACLLRDRLRRDGAPDLPVFSMMFRAPCRSNERRFLDAVLASGGFDPVVLELDGYAPLEGIEHRLEAGDGPTLSPNLVCLGHVVRAAAERGIDVLLDGHGGDEVVSHGYGLLDELAGRGAWLALLRETRGAADNYGRSRLVLARRIAARQPRRDARFLARLLAPLDRERGAAHRPPKHLLDADLLARSGLRERLRGFGRPEAGANEQAQHRAALADPLQSYAFEVHAAFYRSLGVEARYPFWDRRVVEFCLGLPAHEKLSGGWSRLVLRRAMAGVVPDAVLRRRDKVDFSVHLARGLARHHRERIEALFAGSGSPLEGYVDLPLARKALAAIVADPDAVQGRVVQMVWRAAVLGIWLEMRGAANMPEGREDPVAA